MLRPVDNTENLPEPLSNIEGEAALLGALLIENAILEQVRQLVAVDDFHEPLHQRLFAAISRRIGKGQAANPVLLAPTFKTDPAIKDLGGASYLMQLTADGSGLLAPAELADQVHDLAVRRRLRDGLREAWNACADLEIPAADIIAHTERTVAGEEEGGTATAAYATLTIDELEAMPPPAWLVHEAISEDGLSVIYGEPGAGKSFIALDLALRVAMGMDWHGARTKQAGVLYIAAEGARGLGKRITGWKLRHGVSTHGAPFKALPVAVQMLDDDHRAKLIQTVNDVAAELDFTIGLVVVDTVSRSIAGADENKQETMTEFVRGCDEVKQAAGGALLAVHHSGKDKERGMRGSSVLLGAVDAAIRISKSEHIVTFEVEKQKDAEQGKPIYFDLERVAWGPDEVISTLVPKRTDAHSETDAAGISSHQIQQAFVILTDAWTDGRPLSHRPETRKDGRYAPKILHTRLGGEAGAWGLLLTSWLENNCLAFEVFDTRTKQRGLRVLNPL